MKSRAHKNARDRARRKLKKGRNKYVIRKSSGDLVAIQIAIRTKKGVPKKSLSRKLIEELIRHKAETSTGYWDVNHCVNCKQGDDAPGIQLAIIRWRNPDRLAEEDTGWRYADPDSPSEQDDAWGTLRQIISTAPLGIRFDR
jgi:ribosomal protein S26